MPANNTPRIIYPATRSQQEEYEHLGHLVAHLAAHAAADGDADAVVGAQQHARLRQRRCRCMRRCRHAQMTDIWFATYGHRPGNMPPLRSVRNSLAACCAPARVVALALMSAGMVIRIDMLDV